VFSFASAAASEVSDEKSRLKLRGLLLLLLLLLLLARGLVGSGRRPEV
jgi:hypothetical protein